MGATRGGPFLGGLNSVFIKLSLLVHVCVAVSSSTVPAFLWSDYSYINAANGVDEEVLSQQDFADVLFQGLLQPDSYNLDHWAFVKSSAINQPELILAAIGDQVITGPSSDGGEEEGDLSQIKTWLKAAPSSITIPNVDVRRKERPLASTLVSTFKHVLEKAGKVGNVVVFGNCEVEDQDVRNVNTVSELKDFLHAKSANRNSAEIDFVVVCGDEVERKGAVTGEILSAVSGSAPLHYVALYTADPTDVATKATMDARILADVVPVVPQEKCDLVCRYRASILEGVFAALVLLVILLCGLCCMAGVDTPGRFETAKEN